ESRLRSLLLVLLRHARDLRSFPTRRSSDLPEVVALGDVVGEHHAGVLTDAGEHRQQHVALEGLGLVDDHEGVVEGAAAYVGQRQDRKSTRLNSSHVSISYAVFCLKKKKKRN